MTDANYSMIEKQGFKVPGRKCARFAVLAMALIMSLSILLLSGCSSGTEGSSSQSTESVPVRIGTMPTEDFLPMWTAEQDGFFEEAGVQAELLSFDSAQALSAAIMSGEVDMAMVDVPRAVKLCESGTPVDMEWITLGTEASQGAFGVMASADAPYSTLKEMVEYMNSHDDELAQSGVGVASNTVPEYVFEKLCEQEGIDPSTVKVQEVASLPERYSLMTSGQLTAAALPASLLRLGEATGMKLLAEDTDGDNISQSVMIATQAFAEKYPQEVIDVAKAWDLASQAINSDPSSYITLLSDNANLNEAIAETYPISEYPMALNGDALAHPSADLVDVQLAWMKDKGYITKDITYDPSTGAFTVA